MNTLVGPLPRHVYCLAQRQFFLKNATYLTPSFEPVVWFGLVSFPGRCWGCTVMTEDGAVYRNLPPHAIAFLANGRSPEAGWTADNAQRWNCYGDGFTTLVYPYLDGLRCRVKVRGSGQDLFGTYLFTAAPVGDAFSAEPEQAKEFTFVRLDNGRLTVQPTNTVLFEELSFTRRGATWPNNLATQTQTYKVTE